MRWTEPTSCLVDRRPGRSRVLEAVQASRRQEEGEVPLHQGQTVDFQLQAAGAQRWRELAVVAVRVLRKEAAGRGEPYGAHAAEVEGEEDPLQDSLCREPCQQAHHRCRRRQPVLWFAPGLSYFRSR